MNYKQQSHYKFLNEYKIKKIDSKLLIFQHPKYFQQIFDYILI